MSADIILVSGQSHPIIQGAKQACKGNFALFVYRNIVLCTFIEMGFTVETNSEFQFLEVLDERINQAVALISRLRTENIDVKRQNELLEEQLSSARQAFDVLQSKFKKLEAQTASLERFKQREEQIRKKVNLMLSKLNALDS